MTRIAPCRGDSARVIWGLFDLNDMARQCTMAEDYIRGLFDDGMIEVHAILAGEQEAFVGAIATIQQTADAGGALVVWWAQVWPTRAMREEGDWLISAAAYLYDLAEERGARCVVADVSAARGKWRARLEAVGFQPTVVQLEMPVERRSRWVA